MIDRKSMYDDLEYNFSFLSRDLTLSPWSSSKMSVSNAKEASSYLLLRKILDWTWILRRKGIVTNMDLALPKMCWTMDLQGPTGHMATYDWTQIKGMSQDPGWWLNHHSFPSFIEVLRASPPSLIKSPRRLPQDPAGIPPHFYQGIPLGDDSWGSDGLGAAHQEHWPMAINSRW